MTQPRVMVIIAGPKVSGPAKGIFQLLDCFKRKGVSFYLYNFTAYGKYPIEFLAAAQERGIKVHLFKQNGKSYLSLVLQAVREAREKGVNIVQTHGFKPSIIGLFVKYLCGLKWICFMHGTTAENLKVRIYHEVDNFVQLFADRVILVTEAQRNKIFRGNNHTRTIVVHNAVDLANPVKMSQTRRPVRESLGLSDDAWLAVVVGRFSPEKGIDVFIEAFSRVAFGSQNTHAILVGDGQDHRMLERKVRELGIKNRVHFVGYTNTPGDFMIDADIIVLPSRSEGMPNVALEAMALGKPVIGTVVGGIPEIVKNGNSGLLVSSEDAEELASAMLKVLNNKRLSKRLSQGGLVRIRDHFSIERRSEKVFSIYCKLLA